MASNNESRSASRDRKDQLVEERFGYAAKEPQRTNNDSGFQRIIIDRSSGHHTKSDAHATNKLGEEDSKVMTWLHQDPPFHGLKYVGTAGPAHMQLYEKKASETTAKQGENEGAGTSTM